MSEWIPMIHEHDGTYGYCPICNRYVKFTSKDKLSLHQKTERTKAGLRQVPCPFGRVATPPEGAHE